MKADLHVHSIYSDGSMTPEALALAAKAAGLDVLAIADHEMVEGSRALIPLCERLNLLCVPAAELSCMWGETYLHVLAYGIDLWDEALLELIRSNRKKLDAMSDLLIERMAPDFSAVSGSDYDAFARDPSKGGWKALDYLVARGVTSSLREGFQMYPRYGVTYQGALFPPLDALLRRVRAAGGRAVLAHPGESLKKETPAAFEGALRSLIECGIDGVECYYPTHSKEVTQLCLKLCDESDLIVTSGSDCHGAFGTACVGDPATPAKRIRLKDILLKGAKHK